MYTAVCAYISEMWVFFFKNLRARRVTSYVKGVMLRAGSFKRRFLRERDEGQREVFSTSRKKRGVLFDFYF